MIFKNGCLFFPLPNVFKMFLGKVLYGFVLLNEEAMNINADTLGTSFPRLHFPSKGGSSQIKAARDLTNRSCSKSLPITP